MSPKRDAFTVTKVALPTCGGCDQCGDIDEKHLYLLAHDKKYYCKVCFHKMAIKWPKPGGREQPSPEPASVELTDDMVRLAIKYAADAALGGRSEVRSAEERRASLSEDQKVGQVTTLAYHLWKHDGHRLYVISRELANANPWKGDGGSDDPGQPVDVKGSLMRASGEWQRYRLAVRPRERHAGNVYVLALVPKSKPVKVLLVGWLRDEELPSRPEESGVFKGAYTVKATELHDMSSIPGGRDGEGRVQEIPGDDRVQGGGD